MPTPQEILAELKKIKYPGFSRDIVSFGMIKDIEVAHAGITVILTAPSAKPEVVGSIAGEIEKAIVAMAGAVKVKIEIEEAPPPKVAGAARERPGPRGRPIVPR